MARVLGWAWTVASRMSTSVRRTGAAGERNSAGTGGTPAVAEPLVAVRVVAAMSISRRSVVTVTGRAPSLPHGQRRPGVGDSAARGSVQSYARKTAGDGHVSNS